MQHIGLVRDKTKREQGRKDLKVLVGDALVRLSNLNGLDKIKFKELVQPRLLEIVI